MRTSAEFTNSLTPSPLNPESLLNSSGSNESPSPKDRALSIEQAFSTPGSIPYMSGYNYEGNEGEDIELHIDEDLQTL